MNVALQELSQRALQGKQERSVVTVISTVNCGPTAVAGVSVSVLLSAVSQGIMTATTVTLLEVVTMLV
jgi:hypothetical protein